MGQPLMKKFVVASLLALASPAAAQDIRGMELCTAEKTMERRTGCLQANNEFLQQALAKQTRAADDKLKAADAKLLALEARLTKLETELAALKAKPAEPVAPAKKP
ncbi:MAG: hypothetical protein Q7T81_05545 [Pseudolabrys sp.]|nr:hypothetical protein [Pseudolabrys sp.]